MTDFTGERVIPGGVETDLWNEHLARYVFASSYAVGKKALDLGCGTGYGAAELARSATSVVGVDLAPDATNYACSNYPLPNLQFVCSTALAAPFPSASFDFITAFELIEHLDDPDALLQEAHRLLAPGGIFLVSTPNRLYYRESRAQSGPNPYHRHEFDFREFSEALQRHFAAVQIFFQNRTESFAFYPHRSFWPATARIEGAAGSPDEAHFFIGVCSIAATLRERSFVYLPRAANLLREREQHIALLERELATTRQWLEQTQQEHQQLLELFHRQNAELEDHNRWAQQLEQLWKDAQDRAAQLQDELKLAQDTAADIVARYEVKVRELEAENRAKTQWAQDTETRLTEALRAKCEELAEAVRLLDRAEATVEERTLWAQRLQSELDTAQALLNLARASRWLRLGRLIHVGPHLGGS